MGRAVLILDKPETRTKAQSWILKAPPGTRVEFKASKRSIPQNDQMWAALTDIAQQVEHCGRKYEPEIWKCLLMDAWGKESPQYVPSLDEKSIVVLGYRSSDMSKEEMSEFIDFIFAWGAEHGVVFHDPKVAA